MAPKPDKAAARPKDPAKVAAGSAGGRKKALNAALGKGGSSVSSYDSDPGPATKAKRRNPMTEDPLNSSEYNEPISTKRAKTTKSPWTSLLADVLPDEENQIDVTPEEEYIKANSSTLTFKASKEPGRLIPNSIAMTNDPSTKMVVLPCIIRQGGKTIQIYSHKGSPGPKDEQFWSMLADGIKTYKPLFTDKVFGTRIQENLADCHIELAAHLFPSLLNRSGQFRYTEATQSERQIAKKGYVSYLRTIKDNSERLIEGSNVSLENAKGQPIHTHQVVRELLRVLPAGTQPVISERAHVDAINSHTEALAQTGEMIRRELLPVAILASNYTNEARQVWAKLETLITFLVPVLNPGLLKSSSKIKEEYKDDDVDLLEKEQGENGQSSESPFFDDDDDEDPHRKEKKDASDEKDEGTGHDSTPFPSTKQLPRIFVTEMIGGHQCQCKECSPQFATNLETKIARSLHREKTAELIDTTKERIIKETYAKFGDSIEQRVVDELTAVANSKYATYLEDKDGEMRKQAYEEAKKGFEAKLTSEYRAVLEEEVRQEMLANLMTRNSSKPPAA